MGYSPWGSKESDISIKWLPFFSTSMVEGVKSHHLRARRNLRLGIRSWWLYNRSPVLPASPIFVYV